MKIRVKGASIGSGSERSLEIEADSIDHAARLAKAQGLFPYLVEEVPQPITPEQLKEATIESNPVTAEIKAFGFAVIASVAVMIASCVLLSNWLRKNSDSGASLTPSKYERELRDQSDRYGYSMESLDQGVRRVRSHGIAGTDEQLLRVSVEAHKLDELLRKQP